jgi:hypothetical protein
MWKEQGSPTGRDPPLCDGGIGSMDHTGLEGDRMRGLCGPVHGREDSVDPHGLGGLPGPV